MLLYDVSVVFAYCFVSAGLCLQAYDVVFNMVVHAQTGFAQARKCLQRQHHRKFLTDLRDYLLDCLGKRVQQEQPNIGLTAAAAGIFSGAKKDTSAKSGHAAADSAKSAAPVETNQRQLLSYFQRSSSGGAQQQQQQPLQATSGSARQTGSAEAAKQQQGRQHQQQEREVPATLQTHKERFGSFSDEHTVYAGGLPGVDSIINLFKRHESYKLHYLSRFVGRTTGKFWKGDHSFKVTKLIKADGGSLYGACFTIMQVCADWVACKMQSKFSGTLRGMSLTLT